MVRRIRAEREKRNRRKGWLIAVPSFAAAAAAIVAVVLGINTAATKNKSAVIQMEASAQSEAAVEQKGFLLSSAKTAESQRPETVASYEELGDIMKTRSERNASAYRTYGVPVDDAEAVAIPEEEPAVMVPVPSLIKVGFREASFSGLDSRFGNSSVSKV